MRIQSHRRAWTRSTTARVIGGGIVLLSAFVGAAALACMDYGPAPTGPIRDALSTDPAVARAATDKLRAMGPDGLGVLMAVYHRELRRHTGRNGIAFPSYTGQAYRAASVPEEPADPAQRLAARRAAPAGPDANSRDAVWNRLSAAIDAVAAQKDAAYSGLYWHTDIDAARAAARESGRPILSLRLLGTLDTEFSCANSRFFRTVLYANDEVSKALRERFVLHWQSVRPVPRVTIDMGDGRVVERTITGNSVHYVLDAEGRPLDAIPGLYGPRAFLRALDDAAQIARTLGGVTDAGARRTLLRDWHGARAARLTEQWERDLASLGIPTTAGGAPAAPENGAARLHPRAAGAPTAVEAAGAAVGKTAVEFNIVRSLEPRVATLRVTTTDDAWARIAAMPAHAEDARLDGTSRLLVRAKYPAALDAGRRAESKWQQEDPLLKVVANLQRSVSEDTVRNEYGFHRTVHEWFANRLPETAAADVGPLNEKVYAELFLTPSTDPWLGLVPADTYSALQGEGIKVVGK